jgi:hypothetical protein
VPPVENEASIALMAADVSTVAELAGGGISTLFPTETVPGNVQFTPSAQERGDAFPLAVHVFVAEQ